MKNLTNRNDTSDEDSKGLSLDDDNNDEEDLVWDDDEFELNDTRISDTVESKKCEADDTATNETTENETTNDEWLNPVPDAAKTDFGRVTFSASRRNKQLPRVNRNKKKKTAGAADDVDGQIHRLCQAVSKMKSGRCGLCGNPLDEGETKFHAKCVRSRELKQSGLKKM
jgi:hypothetical protein